MYVSTLILVQLLKCHERSSDQEKLILLIPLKLKMFYRRGLDGEACNVELLPGHDCFQTCRQLGMKADVMMMVATKMYCC
jgi:hypothetical protein